MTDHAELPPRSFFNADDLSLLIMEHPDAPQFLAVKIADAHDAALSALVAERDRLREALALIANAIHPRFRAEDDIDLLYANEKAFGNCIEIARAALAQG